MRDILCQSMRLTPAFLLAFLLPAQAALTVCNKSAQTVRAAVGLFSGTDWTSRGWWAIAPKACATAVPAALNSRFYYLFAADGSSGSWGGAHGFCVASTEKFEIKGRSNCARRGFDRKGFFEIDTGSQADYTQSLAD